MKKLFSALLFICISIYSFHSHAQSIGIGTNTPHASSLLELSTTSRGFLPPRMTAGQRNAILNPATGLTIYCTNCGVNGQMQYYNGVGWRSMDIGAATNPVPSVTSLDCAGANHIGTITGGTTASNVSSIVTYTGGNGGSYSEQSISSTGVTGLTATLAAGALLDGTGTLTYTITGTPPATMGTASFALSIGGQSCTLNRVVNPPPATITSLNCINATNIGTLTSGTAATGVSSVVPYTGGNGGPYNEQSVSSTGVTGLTATLSAGNVASGSGNLTFTITGTPTAGGVASFALSIGGQSCTLTRTVYAPGGTSGITNHSCGAINVHNAALPYGTLIDQQGNQYRTIQIGTQIWMAEDLRTTIYRNGTSILNVTDNTQWQNNTTGACCSNNNNTSNDCPYGKLYNWYAVNNANNLCPGNWHVATQAEWNNLIGFLDPNFNPTATAQTQSLIAGGKMKSTGTQYWASPNYNATNSVGFSALPGGSRVVSGGFILAGQAFQAEATWWTSTENSPTEAWMRSIFSGNIDEKITADYRNKATGYSVRCVADTPVITTFAVSGITSTTASSGGAITYSGPATIIARGVVWNTSANPTVELTTKTTDGVGSGSFASNMTGLSAGMIYFVRAYVTTALGTVYGNQISFATTGTSTATGITTHACGASNVHNAALSYGTLTDQDGNIYRTIQIGTQEWMAEDLKTTKYRDGTSILNVTDNTQWVNNTTGAYCNYNNNTSNDCPYGKLYNWYAVNKANNICPNSWHVATDAEWNTLIGFLDPSYNPVALLVQSGIAGGKMKSTGNQYWSSTNFGATNISGFSALPSGIRDSNGSFGFLKAEVAWWSSTESSATNAWLRYLYQGNIDDAVHRTNFNKASGYSVRCVKD